MVPARPQSPKANPLAGRAVAHLANGYTYAGWVEVGAGVVTIDGRLRTKTGPSHGRTYIHREAVKRTYPVCALRRIDWTEPAE